MVGYYKPRRDSSDEAGQEVGSLQEVMAAIMLDYWILIQLSIFTMMMCKVFHDAIVMIGKLIKAPILPKPCIVLIYSQIYLGFLVCVNDTMGCQVGKKWLLFR